MVIAYPFIQHPDLDQLPEGSVVRRVDGWRAPRYAPKVFVKRKGLWTDDLRKPGRGLGSAVWEVLREGPGPSQRRDLRALGKGGRVFDDSAFFELGYD